MTERPKDAPADEAEAHGSDGPHEVEDAAHDELEYPADEGDEG